MPRLKHTTCRVCGEDKEKPEKLGPHVYQKHILRGELEDMHDYRQLPPYNDESKIENPHEENEEPPEKEPEPEAEPEAEQIDSKPLPEKEKEPVPEVCPQCGNEVRELRSYLEELSQELDFDVEQALNEWSEYEYACKVCSEPDNARVILLRENEV